MRLSTAALTFALSCIYWKVSGMLVELVVRPGDNATLRCDRKIIKGQDIHWVRTCSSQIQPPLIIPVYNTLLLPIPRFSVLWNNSSESYDLMIENITESDLGLFYCSTVEKKKTEHNRIIFEKDVYHIGDTLTKLTYEGSDSPESSSSPEAARESVSDCQWCWLILLPLCPVCSLLSAALAFVCGYSCCHKIVLKESKGLPSVSVRQRQDESQEQDNHDEVCYTSLNIPRHGSKLNRSKQLPNPDFSVYNEIKTVNK